MKTKFLPAALAGTALALLLFVFTTALIPAAAFASGSSSGGGGTAKVDSIKVSKCFYDAPNGEMLIKASSSDPTARLYAFLPSGAYLGEVQNGGGSRYGGTVMGYVGANPIDISIVSSSGGNIIVPATLFIL